MVEKKEHKKNIYSRFEFLYGQDRADTLVSRLDGLFDSYGFNLQPADAAREVWDETDAIMITYGDVIEDDQKPARPTLQLLRSFLDEHLKGKISTVHVLPFFPSSSDAGYSVINYKKVRDDIGDWQQVEGLSGQYQLMVDLVINHTSRFSTWFKNYLKGISPGKDYFIEIEDDSELSEVVRPRNSPLLTAVQTDRGMRHVWTTFSDDQIDLDFTNPDVLFEFIDIFLFLYTKGARVIRFDAIAYLWKKKGTKSIHLKETHQIVKLFRDLAACIDPDITIITETNVPFDENVSYFGNRDEAQMIYQFSLPPLLLHGILSENADYLRRWATQLPDLPACCTYLNFTASHDGIGVRPLEGLIPDDEFEKLVQDTKERGGFISYKTDQGGNETPYELNITYFDAFEEPGHPRTDIQMKRFICSQVIMLSLQGVPGIYFHSLTATKNNLKGVMESGNKRDINRRQWNWQELQDCLHQEDDVARKALHTFKELLAKRESHPAFHPEAAQKVYETGRHIFAFSRTSNNENETILILSNFSSQKTELQKADIPLLDEANEGVYDILGETEVLTNQSLTLAPFQTVWLLV